MRSGYVKRRDSPPAGSIAQTLDIFRAEVRFYREIAAVVGVRVPACYEADSTETGTVLVLENMSGWQPGADPVAAARVLAGMHRRWRDVAHRRRPWRRPVGAAADLVQDRHGQIWPSLAGRAEVTPALRALGHGLVATIVASEQAVTRAGPLTPIHGDASTAKMRTSPSGEIALLDWEDVSAAPGVLDHAWLLVSSVEPDQWDDVLAA